MAKKTVAAHKKKKHEKTVYTYKEYVEKLRPKSLGELEDNPNEPLGFQDELTLEKQHCDHAVNRN